jgi:uncharacterized membrane protein
MANTQHSAAAWDDERVDRVIGNLLRAGVSIAAAVVLLAGIVYLVRFGSQPADHRVFHGEPTDLRSVTGIVRAAAALDPAAMVQFGILLLVATPVARVVFSIYVFARTGDWLYVAITVTVLAILLYSLAAGALP